MSQGSKDEPMSQDDPWPMDDSIDSPDSPSVPKTCPITCPIICPKNLSDPWELEPELCAATQEINAKEITIKAFILTI